jgi:hypothetical protein
VPALFLMRKMFDKPHDEIVEQANGRKQLAGGCLQRVKNLCVKVSECLMSLCANNG